MKRLTIILLAVMVVGTQLSFAQMTRKPSPTREPKGAMKKKPDSKKRYLSKINTRKEFDSMARVYHQKTSYALPHVMFVIDRKKKDKIYYVNSQRYRFHKDFLIGNYLVLKGQDISKDVYLKKNRRFVVGTIAWQTAVKKFTFEYWEGDMIVADQIKMTHDLIKKTFYGAVAFKPNSTRHTQLSAKLGIPIISSSDIARDQEYLPLNTATAMGRIHIIDKIDDTVEIGYNEIVVLKEIPLSLPPVRGIITTRKSTPLTHINLLAKGWGIPNAYVKNADELLKEFDGWFVVLETTATGYKIKRADKKATDFWSERYAALGQQFRTPPSDLKVKKIAPLRSIKKEQAKVYGAKAANLGEIAGSRIRNIVVPDGFAIPFSFYDEFMEKNGFYDEMSDLRVDDDFVHNPRHRRKKLEEFRAKIQKASMSLDHRLQILSSWRVRTGGKGVFVRSSSNAEDLPDFSGAGLYDTVPNVKDPKKIIEAVKTVWASLWNYEAYEARERNFVFHDGTFMGVLVQTGIDVESAGVLITKDPFDDENKGAIYIAAKRGAGISVVEGKRVPEQILYSRKSNAIQVLTRSNEEMSLQFDTDGGVKEVPIDKNRRVLTDPVVRRLVTAANQIKRLFGNKLHQDIEWGFKDGVVYMFQSRPYHEGK